MRSSCTCAGQFRTLTGRDELGQVLKTFRGIALHYMMPMLLEVVQWTMKMNGWQQLAVEEGQQATTENA